MGKKLFFDPILSKDNSKSCASCHHTDFAFSDTVSLSRGIKNRIVSRNAPSLINVAYQPYFMFDGGVPSLEMQVLVPIQEHSEFDFNIIEISKRLQKDADYVTLSQQAYNRKPDAFVITRAIAAYERTLIGGTSRYDAYLSGKKEALTDLEKEGMELFQSKKLNCTVCHKGLFFTNYQFENTGLYKHYADSGRARVTKQDTDKAKFKVPSLRNVDVTAPYMHNGSMDNLNQVIDHYATGGKNHPLKSKFINGFSISVEQKKALIAFLKTLTDEQYLSN